MECLKWIFAAITVLALSVQGFAQCSITSSNGWTATIEVTPVDAIPSTLDCQWFYHYEVQFAYTVTFTGSTTNRSVGANVYFNCTGGSGGTPYVSLGTFTTDASGTLTTGNTARGYSAVSAYNYGSNPSCTTIDVNDVGCTSLSLSYWGNGVSASSTSCATGSALPIELIAFDAAYVENDVLVTWSTATETNNDYFTIEYSTDGEAWEDITHVEGAGNSRSQLDYEWLHKAGSSGYYRLKQTDFDGSTDRSDHVYVKPRDHETATTIHIHPNPSNDLLLVSGFDPRTDQIEMHNSLGQTVSPSLFATGSNVLNTSRLPAGVYWIRVEHQTESVSISFVVQH